MRKREKNSLLGEISCSFKQVAVSNCRIDVPLCISWMILRLSEGIPAIAVQKTGKRCTF